MKCWDCKYLAKCKDRKEKIKDCKDFEEYNYNRPKGSTITHKEMAKMIGKSERTLCRWLVRDIRRTLIAIKFITGKDYKVEMFNNKLYFVGD